MCRNKNGYFERNAQDLTLQLSFCLYEFLHFRMLSDDDDVLVEIYYISHMRLGTVRSRLRIENNA